MKRKSFLLRFRKVVAAVVLIVLAALAVLLVGVRIAGFTPYAVMSGSMSPECPVGSLVYVRQVDPESIETEDIITFVADENLTVVTHRVISVERENGYFVTKGDANNMEDVSPVYFENVLGRVVFCVPKLGYVSSYLSTTSGRFAVMALICGLILLMLLPELAGSREGEAQRDAHND